MDMNDLTKRLRKFVHDRDWEKFHSPKNLSMALAVEVAELMEHFQWLTQKESCRLPPDKKAAVKEEIADVFIYLLRLADSLGVSLLEAAAQKIESNEKRYPAERVRGSAMKATEY